MVGSVFARARHIGKTATCVSSRFVVHVYELFVQVDCAVHRRETLVQKTAKRVVHPFATNVCDASTRNGFRTCSSIASQEATGL